MRTLYTLYKSNFFQRAKLKENSNGPVSTECKIWHPAIAICSYSDSYNITSHLFLSLTKFIISGTFCTIFKNWLLLIQLLILYLLFIFLKNNNNNWNNSTWVNIKLQQVLVFYILDTAKKKMNLNIQHFVGQVISK